MLIETLLIFGAVLIIFIGLVLLFSWFDNDRWRTTTHVPRWVKKEVAKISKEHDEIPDSSSNRVITLNGKMFKYRLTLHTHDGELLVVERKSKRFNRKTHIWE